MTVLGIEDMYLLDIVLAQRNNRFVNGSTPSALRSWGGLSVVPCLNCQFGLCFLHNHERAKCAQKIPGRFASHVPVKNVSPLRFFDALSFVDVICLPPEMGLDPYEQGPVTIEHVNNQIERSASLQPELDRTFTVNYSCEVSQLNIIHTRQYSTGVA